MFKNLKNKNVILRNSKRLGAAMIQKCLKVQQSCIDLLPKSLTRRKYIGGFWSYSQACQDIFVRLMLNNKREGVYFEVGAYDEIDHSNTFVLEQRYGWKGVSFEIDEIAARDFNATRKNPCVCTDATKFDYVSYLIDNNYPKQIDYLSLDIEPAEQTLTVLKRLPLHEYRFSVITYEHDCYVSGPTYMNESRSILECFGYRRILSNVLWEGRDFEDWYIDPQVVPESNFSRYVANRVDPHHLFSTLR